MHHLYFFDIYQYVLIALHLLFLFKDCFAIFHSITISIKFVIVLTFLTVRMKEFFLIYLQITASTTTIYV